ncbi:MAG: nicotinic acid mononucleotide adenylyltransferase [Bacteroidetes bacterium]|nr:MAG: nicotinic acid mononucleotide adenylyltransferase [Bacteroidota bacterium]
MNKQKKIGLFFGSFNPIHIGHLIIANYFVEYTDLDKVWFVVSPQNPFKEKKSLLDDHHRLALARIAVEDDLRFWVSDMEFNMPKPSYTIDTLTYLEEKYPDNQFILLAGSDQLPNFHKWKNADRILEYYEMYVYARPGYSNSGFENHPKVKIFNAPQMEISSTFIRKSIKEGKDMRYMLSPKVWEYISEMHFYEK